MLISPTGKPPRVSDKWGSGLFGASRGGIRLHAGCDYICEVNQPVIAPHDGNFFRYSFPYPNNILQGAIFTTRWGWWRVFYVMIHPEIAIQGKRVTQGQEIGTAMDRTTQGPKPCPEMIPHVHLETWVVHRKGVLLNESNGIYEVPIDPEIMMFRKR